MIGLNFDAFTVGLDMVFSISVNEGIKKMSRIVKERANPVFKI